MLSHLLFLLACTSADPTPKVPSNIGPANAIVAADMDGDGTDELVVVDQGRARWNDHTLALEGMVHATVRGDVGGDGTEDVLIATGAGKGYPAAAARLWKLSAAGPEMLWEHNRGRNRVTDIRIHKGEPYISVFAGGKTLVGGWIRNGELVRVTRTQMGLQQIPLSDSQVMVGRIYGDEPRSDGDLRIITRGGEDRILPTLRGVRALAWGDLDNDGAMDILAADGWHFKYGTHARARLVAYRGPNFKDRRIMADFPDEYTLNRIEIVPAVSGGTPRVLATGTQNIYLLHADAMGWHSRKVAASNEVERATVWSGGDKRYAIISGDPARVVALDQ